MALRGFILLAFVVGIIVCSARPFLCLSAIESCFTVTLAGSDLKNFCYIHRSIKIVYTVKS